jgi:excisionase family DNA binding protein
MSYRIAMTVEEAAEYTGIGRNTLRQLIRWETMPILHVGRKKLIRTEVLDEFLRRNQNTDLRDRDAITPILKDANKKAALAEPPM